MKKLLATALSLLGVTACAPEPGPVCEYGCPYATFNLHGTVTDTAKQPLKNIQVRMEYASDTTGPDGKYNLTTEGTGLSDAPNQVSLSDIDPDRHPPYNDTTLPISFQGVQPQGAHGRWNQGTFSLQQDIQLRKK